jgi:DNA replication protein DnaC
MTEAIVELDAMTRRLHMPTVRRLWSELQVRAEKEGRSYSDYLRILLSEEIAHRGQTRVQRMTHRAKFPFLRTIEEFDFTYQTGLRKELLGSYLGPEFVPEGRCLVGYGPSGTGKTHVAIAIAYKAIQNDSNARFVTAAHLIDELSWASREGRLREAMEPYTHPGVLVVDEVGYLSHGPDAADVLFQVVNDRWLREKPMVFTTNKPVEAWGKVLHDADLAEAILDRVLERGRVLPFKGPSYRTRHLQERGVPTILGEGGGRVSGTHTFPLALPSVRSSRALDDALRGPCLEGQGCGSDREGHRRATPGALPLPEGPVGVVELEWGGERGTSVRRPSQDGRWSPQLAGRMGLGPGDERLADVPEEARKAPRRSRRKGQLLQLGPGPPAEAPVA